MRNFDKLAQFLWEKEKVRLDRKCWKGKKIGNPKTKLKGGVRVNNCVPKESVAGQPNSRYKILSSFAELPDTPPHGFWVSNDNKFAVVPAREQHILVLEKLFRIYRESEATERGFVKISKSYSDTYEISYSPRKASSSTINLAKDIAKFYNMTVTGDHRTHFSNSIASLPNPVDTTLTENTTKLFKEFYSRVTAANGSQKDTDYAVTAEGEYSSSGGDNTTQGSTSVDNIGFKNNGPTFTVEKKQRDKAIDASINFLEKLKKTGIPVEQEKIEQLLSQLQKMADSLFNVGIEPVDIIATIKNPRMAERYLITGPSAPGGGGRGALKDLIDIKSGLLADDESNPGGADVTADIENIDLNTVPAFNDPNNGKDQPEGALEENFKDGKNPGRKGLAKRMKVPTKASVSMLRSIAKNSSGEKARMAHWMANMKAGKAKKKK